MLNQCTKKFCPFFPFLWISQAIGYSFDYDEYHAFVHGRLPYDNIKPDPVLKHILKNLRIRKLVSDFFRSRRFSRSPGKTESLNDTCAACLASDIHQRR